MTTDSSAQGLQAALERHGMEFAPGQRAKFERYCAALWSWNENINLTRHTDYEKFVARDLTDTLALAQFLVQGERVLDMGSGGGVPGVTLAIARPDLRVTLCDSVGKKAAALADIVKQTGVKVDVRHERAENLVAGGGFSTVTARAVAPLVKILTWVKDRWGQFDRLLLIKGPAWVAERGEARHVGLLKPLALRKLHSYPLPGADGESVVLMLCPKNRLARFGMAPTKTDGDD